MAAEEKGSAAVAAAPSATAPPAKEATETPPVETPKSKEKPKDMPKSRAHDLLVFFRLLFAADPTWLDIVLIALGVVFAAAAGTPFPLMAILFGQLVDQLNGATCAAEGKTDSDPFDYTAAVHERILTMVYIAIAAFVVIYVYVFAWGVISQRLAQRLRRHYLAALLRQPPSYFDTSANAGEVSSRLHGDIAAVQAGTSEKAGIFIASISFFVTAFVIAFIKQSKLAGMLISMVPCFLLSSVVGGAFSRKYSSRMSERMATASSLASECLRNISIVHAFGAGGRLEAKFAEHALDAREQGTKKSRVSGVQAGLLYFVSYSGNALAFWQGSRFIAASYSNPGSGTTMGDIYTVILVLVDACVMLGNTAPMLPLFSGAAAAFERLNKDMEAPTTIDPTSNQGRELPEARNADIDFNNVSFAYPTRSEQSVLRNVNLKFPAGKYTAIVGMSGSGKSTITALVTRMYDPVEGSITVNGQDLRELNVRSLRSRIGFVQQEPTLLNTSILANIALGLANSPKPEHQHLKPYLDWHYLSELAKMGKDVGASAVGLGPQAVEVINLVREAAQQADAAEFIDRLEDGYATMTGPAGTMLSGGQRQRVALAQALIRDPDILVLDEATASVDSATEKRIQDAVERVAKDRTVISIAHRLSTIRNADSIVVMEAGQVVEQGSYAELMAVDGGAFARMAGLQTLGSGNHETGSLSSDTLDVASQKTDALLTEKDEVKVASRADKTPAKSSSDEEKEGPKTASSAAEELDKKRPLGYVARKIGHIIRPSLFYFASALFAAVIVGATFSSAGVILGHVVGALSPCASSISRLRYLGGFFAGMIFMLASVEFFANFFSWSFFGLLAERLLFTVRVLSFRSLLEQDIAWHQVMTPTKLLSIITKDTAAIGGFSGSTMGTILSILVNFVIAIVLSHIIAWKIAIVCLAIVPILLGSGIIQLKMLARYHERQAGAFDQATTLAVETVHSIRTVAALSLEDQTMTSFSRLLQGPQSLIIKTSAFTNIWLALHHSVGTFVYCLSYWWGTKLITRGEYSQTQFFIIQIAMLVSAKLWGTMFALAPEFARARLSASRVLNIIRLGSGAALTKSVLQSLEPSKGPSGDVEADANAEHQPLKGEDRGVKIVFSNVSFTYPNRPGIRVLDNVSFTIQPGQFCGLVGPSGAGKSTILALVQRLYHATEGEVSVDGRDLSTCPASFRDTVAVVPQDPSLFNGSVRFNVGLGAAPGVEATDAEIEEACRLANIHETIVALPDGYDTECGASAQRFSGGQRQRLAIARALVRRPRLLLLDESTSALDATSEAALQQSLQKASQGTTVLAITHRLHTVQKADTILVVEGGSIVDAGTHNELMERRESYRINAMQQMLQ